MAGQQNSDATPWVGKSKQLELINAATDRELDDLSRREGALQSRASILIGAASLVGAFKLGTGFDLIVVASLALALVAAICGVIVLFPRNGKNPSPRNMRDEIYKGTSDEEALHHMVRVKLNLLDKDEASLSWRSTVAAIGFVVLILSVAVTVAVGVVGLAQGVDLGPAVLTTPSPTVTP